MRANRICNILRFIPRHNIRQPNAPHARESRQRGEYQRRNDKLPLVQEPQKRRLLLPPNPSIHPYISMPNKHTKSLRPLSRPRIPFEPPSSSHRLHFRPAGPRRLRHWASPRGHSAGASPGSSGRTSPLPPTPTPLARQTDWTGQREGREASRGMECRVVSVLVPSSRMGSSRINSATPSQSKCS